MECWMLDGISEQFFKSMDLIIFLLPAIFPLNWSDQSDIIFIHHNTRVIIIPVIVLAGTKDVLTVVLSNQFSSSAYIY